MEPGHHLPHEIVNHEWFSFALDICLHEDGAHQRHGVQKVVEHQYDGICSLPCVEALVNKIVVLKSKYQCNTYVTLYDNCC